MLFKEPEYAYQTLRTLSATSVGAADCGECLETFSHITEGDDESWYSQWFQLATRLEKEAETSQRQGHIESARSAFRRASNYYRTAEFFLHTNPKDPRILTTWRKSQTCFTRSIQGLKTPVTAIKIPFEHTFLPGYLCLVDQRHTPRPLLIAQTGFDGTAEEIYFVIAQAAVQRGYHCLVFEGPGQGGVIREQGIPFRPNWESVIAPVVDFAHTLPQVKHNQMALMGLSFGGYLVPRALAFERRIKWGIANGGVYDFHAVCMKEGLADMEPHLDDPEAAKAIDHDIEERMTTSPLVRWVFANGMYTFQAKTPSEWLKMTRSYHLRDLASRITCRMLIVDSENDKQMEGQARQLYDALKSSKEWMLFTSKEGAGEHCQVGAYALSNERIFNWLDQQIQKENDE